ncbi:MAG: zinc ribbon domain-containing protein [Gemmatimonadetes bacterium]|nr:zinc ribbon domain-containing protein [Gemmatimonadota bacterium]
MPTYEYRCPRGHEFEVFQRISDEPGAACPECGEAAERMISAGAGFLFKGEGFYITDYRSKEYKEKSSAEKSGGSADASKAAGSSGNKPKEGPKSTSKPSEG